MLQTITATPRQLESMIRISEALARMRLSSTVLAADVEEAVRLMKVFFLQPACLSGVPACLIDRPKSGAGPDSLKARVEFQNLVAGRHEAGRD